MSLIRNSKIGKRMKSLEKKFCHELIPERQPFIIRLDGVRFSRWTKILDNKHDYRLPLIFELTLKPFFEKLDNLRLIYQQSDEVNILFSPVRPNSQHPYGGKTYKLLSILSSMLSVEFTWNAERIIGEFKPAYFDARIILPETKQDIIDYFSWRYLFSIRNSIISFATECGFKKRIHGLKKWEIVELLKNEGYDWHSLPEGVRYGFFLRKDNLTGAVKKNIITGKDWKESVASLVLKSVEFVNP